MMTQQIEVPPMFDKKPADVENYFFCRTCLTYHELKYRSPDPRYCTFGYEFLMEEAKLLEGSKKRKPDWMPVVIDGSDGMEQGDKNDTDVQGVVGGIMQTVNDKKSEVCKIQSVTPKRGRKNKELPVDLIKQLSADGCGLKVIAARLKADGINVHYSTVSRLLSKQGILL
jgi:hypothetical protein